MKNLKYILPLGAGMAASAAAFVLLKKKKESPKEKTGKPDAVKQPANLTKGHYSFVSGYKDAATVDVEISYDPEKFSFAVIEDEFPSYTSDSHAAVIYGEDFTAQVEYAGFYSGENFEDLKKHIAEKYKGYEEKACGERKAVKYLDGDNVCLGLPIENDPYSYVLITLMKNKDSDVDYTKLAELPEAEQLLSGIKNTRA